MLNPSELLSCQNPMFVCYLSRSTTGATRGKKRGGVWIGSAGSAQQQGAGHAMLVP